MCLSALSVITAVAVLTGLAVSPAPWLDDAVFIFAGVAPALVGALIAIKKPDNVIGKVLVVIGSAWLLGEASRIYLWTSLHGGLPATDIAAWLLSWTFAPAWALIPVLLSIFPSGRVTSRWLRLPIRVYLPFVVLFAVLGMVAPQDLAASYGDYLSAFSNPLAIEALDSIGWAPLFTAAFDILSGALVIGMGFAALVDLLLRWRRSTGTENLQMRAFALGTLIMFVLLAVGTVLAGAGMDNRILENTMITVAISAPPVAVGIAVLRYRLYGIDRLISRTVTYGLMVATLALVYATIAIGLPRLLRFDVESPVLVAMATLAVAASFNPLRTRLQTRIDRRFNRAQYDAQREVEILAEKLRSELGLDDLTIEVLDVVASTVQPRTASVWLRRNT